MIDPETRRKEAETALDRAREAVVAAEQAYKDAVRLERLTNRDQPATPCQCCDMHDEYNGYGSDGPRLFSCPEGCACHD